MKVLLLGSGGRESALGSALSASESVDELFAAPGNPGLAQIAEPLELDAEDPDAVVNLAGKVDADLVVIGPEAPLVAGVGDALRGAGRRVFGPSKAAARIEGSKAHAKRLMEEAGIHTAAARTFDAVEPATAYMDELGPPYVIKADGLAAGKGVVVTEDRDRAIRALKESLVEGRFGRAGSRVLVEEFLDGPELSLIAFTDGVTVVPCEPAQDYKRAYDGEAGPNTGGMGSYSPVPACSEDLAHEISHRVIEPMVKHTAARGEPFVGAIYAGLALTSKGPKVIEFNARFGDPETQALIPRLESDLAEVCFACATGELSGTRLSWSDEVCVSVVLASGGYPGHYRTGLPIEGLERAVKHPGVDVFHAGTEVQNGVTVTAGGRVLAVSALGRTFKDARARAYAAAGDIHFDGKHIRSDIALRAERAEETKEEA